MRGVESILNDHLYHKYLARNAGHEVNRRFCRHDFQHMLDVARICYIMVLESGEVGRLVEEHGLSGREAVKEIVYAAGLVHDIARWLQYETGADHAEAGAGLARPLLTRAGFAGAEVEAIAAAVREHRSEAAKTTLLGRRLSLADDLSRPCFQCRVRDECYKFTGCSGRDLY